MPIFSGLRFLNEPEISDSGPTAYRWENNIRIDLKIGTNAIYKNIILCYIFLGRDVNSLMFYFGLRFLSFIFI